MTSWLPATIADLVIVAVLGAFLVEGWRRGLAAVMLDLVVLVGSAAVALVAYAAVAEQLRRSGPAWPG